MIDNTVIDELRWALTWRPIKISPKDATPVLVAFIQDGRITRVSDATFNGLGHYTLHGGWACGWATHWMPLPTSIAAVPVDWDVFKHGSD